MRWGLLQKIIIVNGHGGTSISCRFARLSSRNRVHRLCVQSAFAQRKRTGGRPAMKSSGHAVDFHAGGKPLAPWSRDLPGPLAQRGIGADEARQLPTACTRNRWYARFQITTLGMGRLPAGTR
jgi:creatinine amidohydrolase/Fe(II)-dependent formamide hydrolase-like protein